MFVTDVFSGVNKSTDAGQTWVSSNAGIDMRTGATGDAIPVFSLAIDPFDNNEIWVGTQGARGVYKSTDTGATYAPMNNGITENEGLTIRNFTIVKISNVKTVFMSCEYEVGVQGDEFSKVKGIVYKTTDGGTNWTKAWEGNSLARWMEATPSATDPQQLILATGIFDREAFNTSGEGILISTDGGQTWNNSNQGLSSLFVGGMHVDPSNSQIVLSATGNNAELLGGNTGGIYKSTDGGATWSAKVSGNDELNVGGKFTAVQFSKSDPNIVYAANESVILRSDDKGDTWTQQTPSGAIWGSPGVVAGVPIEMTIDADNPDILFINNYGGGVFKSIDAGVSWVSLSKGYTGAQMHSVSVSQQDHNVVGSIGRSGPFISIDRGELWRGVQFGVATFPEWYDIVFDPSNDDHILVSDEHQAKIIESNDGGETWQEVYTHPSSPANIQVEDRNGAKEIVFAPSDASVVYAGYAYQGFNGNPRFEESNSTIPAGGSGYDGFVGDFQNSYGMVRSRQGGASGSWEAINNGLGGKLNVTQIRVDAEDANKVFITLRSGGIFKSTDGGDNWTEITNNLPERNLASMDISRQNSDIIYVGTRFYGVWKTIDGGSSWSQVMTPPQLIANNGVNSFFGGMAVHPTDADKVMASDWWSGIYYSADGGNSWNLMNTGLDSRIIHDIEFSADGKFVYAASEGSGIFSMQFTTEPLARISDEDIDFGDVNITENGTTTFNLSNYGNATLNITDFDFSGSGISVINPPTSIAAGSDLDITISFSPTDELDYDQTLTVKTNAGDFVVDLSGTGQYLVCSEALSISGTSSVCEDETSTLDAGAGFDIYQWFKDGAEINGANQQTYTAAVSGTYTVRVINTGACAKLSGEFEFEVNPLPGNTITVTGFTLIAPVGETYRWFIDGNVVTGETNREIRAIDAGVYTVEVTSSEGCVVISEPVTATPILDANTSSKKLALVYPNPSTGVFKVHFSNPNAVKHNLNLIDVEGKSHWLKNGVVTDEVEVDRPSLSPGVYVMQIVSEKGQSYAIKILVQRQ